MKAHLYPTYKVHGLIFLLFIAIGFVLSGPRGVLLGLKDIILQSDILITDYVELAGIGPAMVNVGLLSFLIMLMYIGNGIKPNGSTIMSMWLMAGFSFFGKNVFNVWPIIFGVFLYSKYKGEPFHNYILVSVLGTCLSPTVSQFAFQGIFPDSISILCGILIGIFVGFILPALSTSTVSIHHGYNLYNLGFAGGLLAMVLMSVLRIFGVEFESRMLWSTGNNLFFSVVLYGIFFFFIIYGYLKNNRSFKNLCRIMKHSGKLVSDYYTLYGYAAYINMGILGATVTTFLLIVRGDLNGPTIAGIFTIVGFGAFGKHPRNVYPIMLGASLASLVNIWELNSSNMELSILFSTALAPIAGQFGWAIGIVTGFLHVAVCMNIGGVHGGMNLYSNGFAAGFVAIIMLTIIKAFKKGDTHEG